MKLATKPTRQDTRVLQAVAAVFAAGLTIAVLSQIRFYTPLTPVPVTLQTLGVLLAGLTFGPRAGLRPGTRGGRSSWVCRGTGGGRLHACSQRGYFCPHAGLSSHFSICRLCCGHPAPAFWQERPLCGSWCFCGWICHHTDRWILLACDSIQPAAWHSCRNSAGLHQGSLAVCCCGMRQSDGCGNRRQGNRKTVADTLVVTCQSSLMPDISITKDKPASSKKMMPATPAASAEIHCPDSLTEARTTNCQITMRMPRNRNTLDGVSLISGTVNLNRGFRRVVLL